MKPLIDKAVDASISSASNSAPNSAIFSASNSALEEAEERYAGRLILTPKATLGLFFIQRYRYLTITQFARITAMHYSRAADKLLLFERQGYLGHSGNTRLGGQGKTPKTYFLTRKGFDLLVEESTLPTELLVIITTKKRSGLLKNLPTIRNKSSSPPQSLSNFSIY